MSRFCCESMERDQTQTCDHHESRFECADALIHQGKDGGFGIIIHDGGSSFSSIRFCPWCGKNLLGGEKKKRPIPHLDWLREHLDQGKRIKAILAGCDEDQKLGKLASKGIVTLTYWRYGLNYYEVTEKGRKALR